MKHGYEKYKKSILWENITRCVKNLKNNRDISVTTLNDYVIGYIVKNLSEEFVFYKRPRKSS